MKKTFYISLYLLLNSVSLFAQNSGKITGELQDKSTNEKLLFANIVLIKASDSSQVKGMSSGAEGGFIFEQIPNGKYLVRVSTLGYQAYLSPLVEITAKNKVANMGVLYLQSSSTNLTEVVVEAKKPFIEHMAGKMVMNVANNAITEGDNALELLKKMPGVFVDKDDAISLNGKKGVLVLIDDRSTYLSGSELANLLKSMPSNTVEKVETIDKPSSKYDAEGVSGIINFKMKKNNNVGFNGSVNAGGGYSKSFKQNAGLNLSYRGKKIGASLAGDYYGQKSKSGFKQEHGFSDGTIIKSATEKEGKWGAENHYQGISARATIDYFINDKHTLGLSVRESGGKSGGKSPVFSQAFFPNGNTNSAMQRFPSYSQGVDQAHIRNNTNTNLNYQYVIDTGKQSKILNIDATWLYNTSGGNAENSIHYFGKLNYDSLLLIDEYTLKQSLTSNVFSLKGDYEQTFSKKAKMEIGAKYSWVRNNNNIIYFQDGVFDTTQSNEYIYKENIAAFYGIFYYDFTEKTTMQLGLRGEYTQFEGYAKTIDSTNSNDYFNLFPNINISQKIGTKHTLDVGYRYRLSRPSYTYLNPFIVKETANSVRTGNPYLKPAYSHGINLNYSFNYMFFVSLDYTHSTGQINNLTYFDSLTLITSSGPVNLGKSDALNLSLNGQFTFFKIWQFNPYIQVSYGQNQIKYNNDLKITPSFDAFAYISNNFTITKSFSLQLDAWLNAPSVYTFSKGQLQYAINFGAKKSFFDKKLTVSLSINDIFNTNSYRESSQYPDGSYQKDYWYWESRSLWVSLRYQFGNQSLQMRNRKANDLEEAGRLGGGGSGKGGGN